MVPLSFAGRAFFAFPQGALFWPQRKALIVADLHFEKASWFARFGQMLPPYDSIATMSDLEALIIATQAKELWCLGDSFHDADGAARLEAQARQLCEKLAGELDWYWIVGNHDAAMASPPCGTVLAEAKVEGLMFRHEADPAETRPELSGHFHPKLRLTLKGRHVARRCFVAGGKKLILPAFGALTGGLDVGHPEIRRATGAGAQALVPVADRLLRFPIAA
jgi:DNA ligase-associated metallophosphoesterase